MSLAIAVVGVVLAWVCCDLVQRQHAILRNFPVIGHFRYWLEAVGPELRQYIVTGNDEERPFSRDQRRWVYASAKARNNYFAFGTDSDLEIKLSQGAKPGLGGVLPAAKVTPEIAAIRGIPVGRDCISPARHSAFSDVDSMLDFAEALAERTGLPVGIKSAVGEDAFWVTLADAMASGTRGVDFVTIDGGEGGTGAAPLVFTDHVSLPFKVGFSRVYRVFAERGLTDRIAFVGSGKLGFPETALLAMALGCDMVNVAREAMLAVGCIQAQRCHTGRCPTGVATQSAWLARGLDPPSKAARLATYVATLRKELEQLARACGVTHPSQVTLDSFELLDDRFGARTGRDVFGYAAGWGFVAARDTEP